MAFRKSEDGELWLPAAEIGKALGYAHPKQSIDKLVREHSDEFDSNINQVVLSATSDGNLQTKTRLFNIEGIALICMFSEQPIAKKFRNPGPMLREGSYLKCWVDVKTTSGGPVKLLGIGPPGTPPSPPEWWSAYQDSD